MTTAEHPSKSEKPELVFALVGGAGVRLDVLKRELELRLKNLGYKTVDIRLSRLLPYFKGWVSQTGTGEYERIIHHQYMGNLFRKQLNRGDALALAGIAEIQTERAKSSKSQDEPVPSQAYIVHQLKHPDEVDLLRQVYGPSFFLIAGHAPRKVRIKELVEKIAHSTGQRGKGNSCERDALEIIMRDEKEEEDFGQNVRDTYPKSDFFCQPGIYSGEWAIGKFVELLFGHPSRTPSRDEYAMYLADAISLRSSDRSRQVGAVIIDTREYSNKNKSADVVAVGMNEVPCAGGGYPWDQDSPDHRDQMLEDRARGIKEGVLTELIERLKHQRWLTDSFMGRKTKDLADDLYPHLKGTQFLDIGEFGRTVHAEMAALIDAARRGVAVDGHSMYVTTFPCHNCAKHIIAAGIRRVIYLEPYPKSRTEYLHGEEVDLDALPGNEQDVRVAFYPFTGIAPRQYRQLFSMSMRGGKKGKTREQWIDGQQQQLLAPLNVPQKASLLYLDAERQAVKLLPSHIYVKDKN